MENFNFFIVRVYLKMYGCLFIKVYSVVVEYGYLIGIK